MKYLVLDGIYPAVAIPLEALAVAGDIKFLESTYVENKKVFWPFSDRHVEGRIVDESEFLNSRPEEKKED